ncbi:glutamyl-tRNA reductase [Kocuria coralli]|uniref:Glutamyl-tRNA reductase n=1 Tax=Kocuria coralli TaxID=1461025 RepID=A0A5J5L0R1_9MICC|nr:glutamyl-tRNA reductase [Kocuria coralli]KAA9395549.1 glutamyl-tRNA reductase [Kocuria coralli]
MVLFSLVASHRDVDLTTVAKLADGAVGLPGDMVEAGALTGAVALSTCNRLELYGEWDIDPDDASTVAESRRELVELLARRAGFTPGEVSDGVRLLIEEDAAKHLFTVVSGLESAVVGEREITGQVRRALIEAQRSGTASGELIRLFETAAQTAREVGTHTSLGERGRSIVSVALDLADDVTDGLWPERRALVFGTGAYAGATMAALRDRGCADIEVYSASGRADAFTANRGGTPVAADGLPEALRRCDVVIGCSGGSEPMAAEDLPSGPLTVVDLALSRDFDPAAADLPDVELITLESVKLAAPEETGESVAAAERIVDQATRRFRDRRSGRDMSAAIVALRQHTMGVLEKELEKIRKHHGCTGATEEVEFAMRRMVRSLLHEPTVRARQLAEEGRADDYLTGLEAVFGIEVPGAQEPTAEQDPTTAAHGTRPKRSREAGPAPSPAGAHRDPSAGSEPRLYPLPRAVG